jgi:hypothetical protein
MSQRANRLPALRRWKRSVSILTLVAVTGCSTTMELVPPSDLDRGGSAPDTSKIKRSLRPGHWHSFRGYTDSRGVHRSVDGRVRTVPGDSLELELLGSTSSLTRLSHRSVVPRDSIGFMRVARVNTGGTLLYLAAATTIIIYIRTLIPAHRSD